VVHELDIDGTAYEYATAKVSNGVWAFWLPDSQP
jgi:hypothetical protein